MREETGRAADLPDSDVSVERIDLKDALAAQEEWQADPLGLWRSGREHLPSTKLREALHETSHQEKPRAFMTMFGSLNEPNTYGEAQNKPKR